LDQQELSWFGDYRQRDNANDCNPPSGIRAYYTVDYVKNTKGTSYWRNRTLKVARTLLTASFLLLVQNVISNMS